MAETAEADKIYNDIFGDSDDDDVAPPTQTSTAGSQPISTLPDMDEDDIFASSDEEDDKDLEFAKFSRLSKKKSSPAKRSSDDDDANISSSSKKKEKKEKKNKKDKKEKKKKRDRGDDDDDNDEGGSSSSRKKRKSSSKEKKIKSKSSSDNNNTNPLDSGDEYASEPEVEKTAEDDLFIDKDEDENKDLVKDYDAQTQSFNDEKPEGRIKNKSGNVIDDIMNQMKKPKQKAEKDLSKESCEAITDSIIEEMLKAAQKDDDAFSRQIPATEKLKILPKVEKTLFQKYLQTYLLEHNVLSALNAWISPKDSQTLSAPLIRTSVYRILQYLPCQNDHLRRSGIGKTILALKKHKLETVENKKILREIIEKWSRPIFTNANQDNDDMFSNQTKIRTAIDLQKSKSTVKLDKKIGVAMAVQKQKDDSRVRVPYSQGFMFTVAPSSRSHTPATALTEGKNTLMKKMKSNLKSKGPGKLMEVSMSGRKKQ